MDVHKAELHASGFRAIIEVANAELGKEAVAEMCRSLGTSVEELSDQSAWFSMALGEELLAQVVERIGDEGVVTRIMKLMLSPRYLGFVYPLFRAVGTPALLYGTIARLLPRLNKVVQMSAESTGRNRMRISARRVPGAPAETRPHFCRTRAVQLSEGTTILGLPPARVEHPLCMLRGDEACVYDVEWSEHRWPILSGAGFVFGALGAAWLVRTHGVSAPTVLLSAGLCIGGWAAGRVYEVKRALTTRLEDLNGTYGALEQVTKAHEQRVAELMRAKAEVEQKVQDRTHELRLTTQQLSETLHQVQELDRAKTNFFSNVSHELRTPLTLILGPLDEMVLGREPAGGTTKAIEVMQRNAARLLQLINQLLDLAKVDAGKVTLALVPTDPVELAKGVEARFAAAAGAKGIALKFVADPVATLPLDTAWMESALTNLVANALRFATKSVEIRVGEESGVVRFQVEDDGAGIAAADLATVFDRFEQGSDAQARKGGTGLGLAITREAARLHGGEASVRSVPGVATTFTLTLPRATPTIARHVNVEGTSNAGPPGAEIADRPSLASVTTTVPPLSADGEITRPGPAATAPLVVVVEDDDDLRGFIADVLAKDYRVRSARNGVEALELITTIRPDAVVSDVSMPRMDGYELCRRLREQDQFRSLPVLLLTARRDVDRVLEGFEVGADDYLTKPFHARELLARLALQVQLRRMVSQLAHQERLASLGVLAASLAHQIRNPLVAIMAGLPAMRTRLKDKVDERSQGLMDVMMDCAGRIERITVGLMDLSRVDDNAVEAFKPGESVEAILRLIRTRDSGLPGTARIEADIDPDVMLYGKPGDINHVILNLIDNATKAVSEGGCVRVYSGARSGKFIFEVGDSGPGIESKDVESIFKPFWSTRAAGEGTGLGLAIARQVVLQHGGDIAVGRSELGGALFTVTLPIALTPA